MRHFLNLRATFLTKEISQEAPREGKSYPMSECLLRNIIAKKDLRPFCIIQASVIDNCRLQPLDAHGNVRELIYLGGSTVSSRPVLSYSYLGTLFWQPAQTANPISIKNINSFLILTPCIRLVIIVYLPLNVANKKLRLQP